MNSRTKQRIWGVLTASFLLAAGSATAATLYTEAFATDDAGWFASGFAAVSASGTEGQPAFSLEAQYSPFFFPLLGGFRADATSSGGNFFGDYLSISAKSISFDFKAADATPSLFTFRMFGGGNEFYYTLTPPVVGSWNNFGVPLEHQDDKWTGGNAAQFYATLASVEWIEVTVQSTAMGLQNYYLDNVKLSEESLIVIPEPGYGLVFAFFLILIFRRRFFDHSRTESRGFFSLLSCGVAAPEDA